jgi:hypothetical protein
MKSQSANVCGTTLLSSPEAAYHSPLSSLTKFTPSQTTLSQNTLSHIQFSSESLVNTSLNQEQDLEKGIQLPQKRHGWLTRHTRYTIFTTYRRLFTFVVIVNLISILIVINIEDKGILNVQFSSSLATAASANLFVTTAVRQDYILNTFFRLFSLIPISTPLSFRRNIAKFYEFGGIHSGTAVSGTLWFILLTINVWYNHLSGVLHSVMVITITSILLFLLLTIIILAHPQLRVKMHDIFERSHRWAGWLVVMLFWVELIMLCYTLNEKPHGLELVMILFKLPSFWLLLIITFHTVLPWFRLRPWEFEPEILSDHAIRLNFKRKVEPFTTIGISTSPLKEWHAFATFPSDDGPGGSIVVSNAGDFTSVVVNNPRTKYWVKGLPRDTLLSMVQIFRTIVMVSTGSGIGPALSILATSSRKYPVRILWSTPSPLQTFGTKLCDTVKKLDPYAMIHDTRVQGRPNMVALTYQLFIESRAEAVFVVSNPKVTRKIKYGLESRGIPVFGPIFDS